jgi:hypothetical protein
LKRVPGNNVASPRPLFQLKNTELAGPATQGSKLFSSSLTKGPNKLERLSLTSLSPSVLFVHNARVYIRGA